jgi:molecular chaperone GrpE
MSDQPNPDATPDAPSETPSVEAASAGLADVTLAEKDAEIAELKDRLLRAAAEMENIRRRLEKEKQDAQAYAVTSFARDLLDVADNFGRASSGLPADARAGVDGPIKTFVDGVGMVERLLIQILERHGVRAINAQGARFDPNQHQAMMEIETDADAPGTVVQVLQAGYMLKDRLLRPALVGVAKAGGGAKPDAPQRVDTTV